jgi:signal transduction histidine kinase
MLTRVEIVALLAHDLGHKTMEAALAVEDYTKATKRVLTPADARNLEDRADKALRATQQIGSGINQFRQLYRSDLGLTGKAAEFDFGDVVRYVESTLAGALARKRVTVKTQYTGGMKLFGHKEILIQVFFNLVINSLEAIGGMRNPKPASIHIHAHEEKQANPRRIVVQFWDEGPGINRQIFQPPDEIFNVGRTSKPTGTGTGLPVARRLLSQYFGGDISLANPDGARFRIILPERLSS